MAVGVVSEEKKLKRILRGDCASSFHRNICKLLGLQAIWSLGLNQFTPRFSNSTITLTANRFSV